MERSSPSSLSSEILKSQPLAARAAALRQLAIECKEWQKRTNEISRSVTRRDELVPIANRLRAAASAYQVLVADPKVKIHLEPASRIAGRLQAKAKELLDQIASDPQALLKQKALDIFRQEDLAVIERALHASWQWFLGVVEPAGIETVLRRFSSLRETANRLASLRSSLQKHAEKLPTTSEAFEEGLRLKQALANELKSLEGTGLDQNVLHFLRRSLEGVPLPELLRNDKILRWLEENNLTEYFQVRST
jgi:hypothetical protein